MDLIHYIKFYRSKKPPIKGGFQIVKSDCYFLPANELIAIATIPIAMVM